jgi:flagellar protein FliO/FliZ
MATFFPGAAEQFAPAAAASRHAAATYAPPPPTFEAPSFGGVSLRLGAALALLWLAYWLLKRFGRRGAVGARSASTPGALTVLDRLPLEPRRALYLVGARGRSFLIGSGESGLSFLGEVRAGEGPVVAAPAAATAPSFADRLQTAAEGRP